MSILSLLGIAVVLFLLNVILIYRGRAEEAKHRAELQKTVTDAVMTTVAHRQTLDAGLAQIEEKHRAETIEERAHLAERADFDNDWDGLPNYPSGYGAANSSVAAADPASLADD